MFASYYGLWAREYFPVRCLWEAFWPHLIVVGEILLRCRSPMAHTTELLPSKNLKMTFQGRLSTQFSGVGENGCIPLDNLIFTFLFPQTKQPE